MTVPILVLNCGSSSIKFALFDGAVEPLPRTPLWDGKVEGIGGTNARLVERGSAPVKLMLGKERPHHDALQRVRACVSRRTSRVRVAVAPTNEEWMAARHAIVVLRGRDAATRALDVVTESAHGS